MATKSEKKFEISVSYNGVIQSIPVNSSQKVQAVLQHALNAFGIRENRDNFTLFSETGQEVAGTSVEGAGLAAGSLLLLRPRRVSGGA